MSKTYDKILKEPTSGLIVEKKSKFICNMIPVDSEEAALEYIKSKKKEYYDARHNCYAYIIGSDGATFHSSDDGEPSGTAGRPMLDILQGAGLYNVVCIVTRYFGGVLLGTGGLIRAYSDAVKSALEDAKLSQVILGCNFSFECDYNTWGKIEYYIREKGIIIKDTNYDANVCVSGVIEDYKKDDFIKSLTEISAARVAVEIGDALMIEL